jgi:hypothetical protein
VSVPINANFDDPLLLRVVAAPMTSLRSTTRRFRGAPRSVGT